MAKQGLWANINRRKRLGISRPKSETTISKEAYSNMKKGFPKKKAKGGMAMDESMAHEGKESKAAESKETRLEKKGFMETKSGKMIKKKMADGGMTSEQSNEKYYKIARDKQDKFRKSEKELDKKYKQIIEKEREDEYINSIHPEDSTMEQYRKGGIVKRGLPKLAKRGWK
jgi:hypothetical protein